MLQVQELGHILHLVFWSQQSDCGWIVRKNSIWKRYTWSANLSSRNTINALRSVVKKACIIVSTYRLTHGSATKAALCGIVWESLTQKGTKAKLYVTLPMQALSSAAGRKTLHGAPQFHNSHKQLQELLCLQCNEISTSFLNVFSYLKLKALCCLPSFSSSVLFYPFTVILSQSVIKFPVFSCKHLTFLASLEHQWRPPSHSSLIPRDWGIQKFAWASFQNKVTLVFLEEASSQLEISLLLH